MNAKTIDALKVIRDQLNIIIDIEGNAAVSSDVVEAVVDKVSTKTESSQNPTPDKDMLSTMPYAELKKYAKSMGVSGSGSRQEIIDRILGSEESASEDTAEDKTEETPVEETPAPAEKTTKRVGKKLRAKKNVEPEPEPEVNDPVYDQVIEATEEMSDQEIKEFLAECDIKVRGKRESLISALVEAVKEGIISLDDDGEDNSMNEDDSEPEESKSKSTTIGNITSAREEAIKKSDADVLQQFKDGDITRDDLLEWYAESFGKSASAVNKMKDNELITAYAEVLHNYIDDEGVTHDDGEEEPYFINEEPFHCGEKLKFNEDDNTYICEVCGEEYSAE